MPYSSVLERASGTHKYSVQQELSLLTSTCSVVCLLPQAYSNKLRLAALEVPGFIFLWCLGAQRKGMVINMDYMTLKEASEKWGISSRQVNYYWVEGRIPGAVKIASVWLIPKDAEKPVDGRRKNIL